MLRFTDKRITSGDNAWIVSGTVYAGKVTLTRIHGDIVNYAGMRNALKKMIEAPRYRRAMLRGNRG